MNRYIVLLRGINVGGKNKLLMAELRASLEGAGFSDVVTYIQSGNVAMSGPSCDAEQITAIIERDFDLRIPVVVRTAEQLRATIDNNPFPEVEDEPKRLLVFFCADDVPAGAVDGFDMEPHAPDRLAAGAGELYVAYHAAASQSKLTNSVLDKLVGGVTTARNWRTVLKLAEMVDG